MCITITAIDHIFVNTPCVLRQVGLTHDDRPPSLRNSWVNVLDILVLPILYSLHMALIDIVIHTP